MIQDDSNDSFGRRLTKYRFAPWAVAVMTISQLAAVEVVSAASPSDTTPRSNRTTSGDKGNSPSDDPCGGDSLADMSLEELMDVQVVVTAARREQKITSVPYAISVVTAADIRAAGARSIPDALRLVPGVDVADLTYGNVAVSPRGFHGFISSQILVLVDGRQIYDSFFGGTVWGSWPFLLEDVDRIEVIRGPGGVTWGANAVNGVINIITKDPADQLGLTLSSTGASRGSFRQYMGYGLQDGKLRLRFSAEYETSEGFLKGGSFLRWLDDNYQIGRFSLHAVYDADEDTTFTFSMGSAIQDGGYPATPLAGFTGVRRPDTQASYLLGRWSRRIAADSEITLTGFVNDYHASPGLKAMDYRYQQIGFQFSHTFQPSAEHTRTWGIDTRFDLLDAGNADPYMLSKNYVSTGIIGLYLQDEWRLAPRWTLTLGGRIDYEFYGGFQPSARASLAYKISDDAMVYGSVSRAFPMPTASARFLQTPLLDGLAHLYANGNVDPPTLIAYEIGYRGRLFDRIDTNLNLFWHDYDEVTTFETRLGPPSLLQIEFDNRSGNVALYGVEFDANYAVTERLTLVANYTYQQLNWDVDQPFTARDFMTPPKHKAMFGARYSVNDDFRLTGHLYFVDAVKAPNPVNPFAARGIDPYLRLDLRAEHDLWNDQASFAVGVRNLLDPQHYEGSTQFLNDAETPRMIFAEFRVRIP